MRFCSRANHSHGLQSRFCVFLGMALWKRRAIQQGRLNRERRQYSDASPILQLHANGEHHSDVCRRCPLWVGSGPRVKSESCLLYPRNRTFARWCGMSAYSITPSARTSRRRHVEADCLGGLQVDPSRKVSCLRRSEAVRLKIKHLLTIRSPNRGRLGRESASKAKQQMLGKSNLVEILSRDLACARNRREALASDVITLTAEIAVLEASLLTENDRRERERAARRKANDEECIRV